MQAESVFQPTFDSIVNRLRDANVLFISAPWLSPEWAHELVDRLNPDCELEVWLRMNCEEITLNEGLATLSILADRPRTRIGRQSLLHWKAYLSETDGLLGSSNFTAAGLPMVLRQDGPLEGIVELVPAQLASAWKLKEKFDPQIFMFPSGESAKAWWAKHAKSTRKARRRTTPKVFAPTEPFTLPRPYGFMR